MTRTSTTSSICRSETGRPTWQRRLMHWDAPEVVALMLGGAVYLYNPLRFSLPVGYAGLSSLMAETIKANGCSLPSLIPCYGQAAFRSRIHLRVPTCWL